ncbi:hypothetical protein MRBLMI12_001432 [Microbacterium sp. LMI12-1-1.1]|uniref:FtsX-like permease family protein n=1 Tax=Microbacterium sp. LMI12-1-1.1 TaxID=3135225 RepID=UPI003438F46F
MTTTPLRRPAVSAGRLVRARLRSRVGLAASIAAAIAVAIGLLCALPAAAAMASAASIRAAIPDPGTAEGWLQVHTRPGTDAAAQDDAGRAVIADLLEDDVRIETVRVGEPGSDFERVAWRLTPTPAALDADGVERLARGLARVPEAIRESDAAEGGIVVSGGLADAVDGVAVGAIAAAAITPVPIVILAVLAWFAVLQLARLLGAARGRETRVLVARGLSAGQDTALAGIEAAVIVTAGTVAGVAGAVAAVATAWGAAGIGALTRTWPLVVLAVVVLGATLLVSQLRGAKTAAGADSVAGRIARAASPGVAVLLVLVGVVLVLQASQIAAGARAPWSVAVTVLAPTVGIAAVAVLAVILFAPLSALVAQAAARGAGATPSYPARQVARRLRSFSVAVALVSIVSAGAVLAGAYGATWSAASADSQQVTAGAALRAAVDPVSPGAVATAGDTSGVTAVAPALSAAVVAGGVAGTLVALPPDSMPDVLFEVPGVMDPVTLAAEIAAPRLAVEMPDDATGLRFEARVSTSEPAAAEAMQVRVWLDDAAGVPVTVPLDVSVDEADGAFALTAAAELPRGEAPWRIVALEVGQGRGWPGAELLVTGMRMLSTGDDESELVTPVPHTRLHSAAPGGTAVRSAMVWTAGGETPPRIPAVVTDVFAEGLGLGVGDDVDVRIDGGGRTIAATVASIVAALPGAGAGAGVLVSLDAAIDAASATSVPDGSADAEVVTPPLANEVWAAGDESAAAALSGALDAPVATVGSPASAVAGEVVTLWDAAAVGGALLAGVALVALLAALTAQRAGEVLVLRALGVPPTAQARMRGIEVVVVVVLGVVLGAAGGASLAALLVPRMAERAVPDVQLPPTLSFSPWPVVIALAVVGVALAVAVLGSWLAVRRQGSSTRIEEAAP